MVRPVWNNIWYQPSVTISTSRRLNPRASLVKADCFIIEMCSNSISLHLIIVLLLQNHVLYHNLLFVFNCSAILALNLILKGRRLFSRRTPVSFNKHHLFCLVNNRQTYYLSERIAACSNVSVMVTNVWCCSNFDLKPRKISIVVQQLVLSTWTGWKRLSKQDHCSIIFSIFIICCCTAEFTSC
jgi:hypothetical protein